ncbi:hypothetical protein GCK32_003536 [Trichostrongylus colubriformis]|uniref:Uncharacterized protein n=1 Tax=Trichostrongylus colubriformis TaxID=6319 RepID=A0AAN8F514_TRICO
MFVFVLLFATATCTALPKNRERLEAASATEIKPIGVIPVDPFTIFDDKTATVTHIELVTAVASATKKTEKLPLQKTDQLLEDYRPIPDVLSKSQQFENLDVQSGITPKLSASAASQPPIGFEFFDFGENSGGPIASVNPAATYLEGGAFDQIATPNCRMTTCRGPVPNDGSFMVTASVEKGKACHQTFVPMNSCTDNKGYDMGMLCSICCDCTASFVREMRRTHGFKIGFQSQLSPGL